MVEHVFLERRERASRISVTGRGGNFRVQLGDDGPVSVSVRDYEASCECGRPWCAHVESLRACGFLEDHAGDNDLPMAA